MSKLNKRSWFRSRLGEAGVVPVFVLIAGIGLVAFLVISSSGSFKDRLFSLLYPKPSSYAVSNPISGPVSPSPSPTPVPDITAPTVSITYPVNGSVVRKNTTVVISATASDNVAVVKVEFYAAGKLLCTDTAASYNCSWNVPKKPRVTYNITAKAYDSSNNSSTSSISVTSK